MGEWHVGFGVVFLSFSYQTLQENFDVHAQSCVPPVYG